MLSTILLGLASGGLAVAADCFQGETRTSDAPTGTQIGQALKLDLADICATTFKTGDDQKLQITYSHWSESNARFVHYFDGG